MNGNWITRTADKISSEIDVGSLSYPGEDRIAAIIATFAEPLVALLREARREHYHCNDSWYCCGKCTHSDHVLCDGDEEDHEHNAACYLGSHKGEAARTSGICNCGADAWNARVDAVLGGTNARKS